MLCKNEFVAHEKNNRLTERLRGQNRLRVKWDGQCVEIEVSAVDTIVLNIDSRYSGGVDDQVRLRAIVWA